MAWQFCITGASRGIGLELTQFALEAGHQVCALVRNPNHARTLNSVYKQYPAQLKIAQADVTDEAALRTVAAELGEAAVDVFIHNAGVFTDNDNDFLKLTKEELLLSFATNTFAPVLGTQVFLRQLQLSSNPKLICITSLMGSLRDNTSGGYYAYRMSKAALNMFVRSFAIDYPKITTLTMHPGWVRTDMGGPQAPLLPRESARGLFKFIVEATNQNSGRFYDYSGKELPW